MGERPQRLVEGTVNLHHAAHTQPCHAALGCDIVAHDRIGRVLTAHIRATYPLSTQNK